MLKYAGIGSRSTPLLIRRYISTELAPRLDKQGWFLRSGGALGADQAFAQNVPVAHTQIYVVKPGIPDTIYAPELPNWADAVKTVVQFHPKPSALTGFSLALMARNAYQILGANLKSPVDMVVCWTPGGTISGGTGQALRMAKHYGIPIYNLGDPRCNREEIGTAHSPPPNQT